MSDIPPVSYHNMSDAIGATVAAARGIGDKIVTHARDEHARRQEAEQVLVARRKLERQQVTRSG